MDYFGIKLATCSSDRAIRVFDVKQDQYSFQQQLKGHEGPVWQLAWAHPMFGTILASCSYDKKVIIWKETNKKWDKLYEYAGHESSGELCISALRNDVNMTVVGNRLWLFTCILDLEI